MFDQVRRKNREWNIEEARELLLSGEYGTLSMFGENGYGYGIPMSYAMDGDKIYFHCAPEGFKLNSLKINNKVSFSVVGKTKVLPGQFSTEYQSVLVFGKIEMNLPDEEKKYALNLIVDKYSPDHKDAAEKYISKSFNRTNVIRLDIEHISGKHKEI